MRAITNNKNKNVLKLKKKFAFSAEKSQQIN